MLQIVCIHAYKEGDISRTPERHEKEGKHTSLHIPEAVADTLVGFHHLTHRQHLLKLLVFEALIHIEAHGVGVDDDRIHRVVIIVAGHFGCLQSRANGVECLLLLHTQKAM